MRFCGHGKVCGFAVAQAHLAGALDGDILDLCWAHLNVFLDAADDHPELEPARLVFLSPPRGHSRRRWLWWSHDPDVSPVPAGATVRVAA